MCAALFPSRILAALSVACATAFFAPATARASVLFVGSSGSLSASVLFSQSGSTLTVTLTNTSATGVSVPGDVLTAVFFSAAGDPTLTRTSAVLNAGSSVIVSSGPNPGTDPGGVVGGEWAYQHSISNGSLPGVNQGISSSGFSIFGPPDRFPGTNLQGPTSPDGVQYGIVGTGGITNPNGGIQKQGLIQNSVVFTLSGLPAGFNVNTDIGNVSFQYGTSLDETRIPGHPQNAPEPATILLMGLSMGGLAAFHALKRKRTKVQI
jgi:hypothetical protein